MQLSRIIALLECEIICGVDLLDAEVTVCFAADLMSDVLAFSRSNAILLTGLTGVQSIHAADVADLRAIVFVHDKRPGQPSLELATNKGIPLLTTKLNMFDACGILHANGVKGA
jgi:hypothetical protein